MEAITQEISLAGRVPLSLSSLIINLLVGVLMALILRWHFKRFGSTQTNREEFADVFPFILLTTILIIYIVKSSLALSLGLVGALSIVRFRTPVKEPEELAYLFIAIAVGLGLGADRTLPTVVASLSILMVMAAIKWVRKGDSNKDIYLSVDWTVGSKDASEKALERINNEISKHVVSCNLRRYDARDDSIEATYYIRVAHSDDLSGLVDSLRSLCPGMGVTFLDQNRLGNP